MELRFMNWREAEEYLKTDDRIIVPLGSTEQHGPFGLFGTDHMISDRIARDVAEKLGIIAAPVIPLGMSLHHMAFPGSLTFKPTTMMQVVGEVLESLNQHGFKRVMLLNGHGGNRDTVRTAFSERSEEFQGMRIHFRCWWETDEVDAYIKGNFGEREGHHSAVSETSLIMHLFPDEIKPIEVPYRKIKRPPYLANKRVFRKYYPDGVMGADVSLASADHGAKLFDLCVSSISAEIEDWEEVD